MAELAVPLLASTVAGARQIRVTGGLSCAATRAPARRASAAAAAGNRPTLGMFTVFLLVLRAGIPFVHHLFGT
jgi:hypothetical protein